METVTNTARGALVDLLALVEASSRLMVLTGAGCSTESGIPDYRAEDGRWKTRQPMSYAEFTGSERARQRYWAGSLIGWRRIAEARPNAAHRALADLEAAGRVQALVTQNVDGLHQRAGSRRVIDLHGRLDTVSCLQCGAGFPRRRFQRELERANPEWSGLRVSAAPDGDARLASSAALFRDDFAVPRCPLCQGVLKPGVVFFGESVPRDRVEQAFARLRESDALLVVGSSLMVWSGYRFVREARRLGMPVAAVNRGATRADAELDVKLEARAGEVLPRLLDRLSSGPASVSPWTSRPSAGTPGQGVARPGVRSGLRTSRAAATRCR